jgi:spore germination cell wall hydrolase CwlJ-like protein
MMIRALVIALALVSGAQAHVKRVAVPKITSNNIDIGAHYLGGQTEEDIKCLAYSIYREAGNQTESAQFAVGQVHVNRAREGSWGHSLCQVVYAKAQFSWTLEQRTVSWTPRQSAHFRAMAEALVTGIYVKGLESTKILHYHTVELKKKWDAQGKPVAIAGAHIFFANVPH